MAFSSLYQSYIQGAEMPVGRQRDDGALKRYESVEDHRAWSMDGLERSKFIHDIIKRQPTLNLTDATSRIGLTSKNDFAEKIKNLMLEIKKKDVELDKIHTLFKQTSKKLEEMNDVIKEKQNYEAQLKDSELTIQKLSDEKAEKDEKLKFLEEKIDCSPSKEINTDETWCKIKNLPDLYENVVKERNALKSQLCKMSCVEDLLKKLKKRADEADELENQVCCLQREIQRSANGGAGDKSSKCQIESACNQCQQYSSNLCLANSMLDEEIKKCNKIHAEVNFLRARVRSIDVMEAELILYKTKYEEANCKLLLLKESFVRSEIAEKQHRDSQNQLVERENQLKESERHVQELINVVERQELDLKEREVYIECIMQRIQQDHAYAPLRQAIDIECHGKVKTIVRQLSNVPTTNCRCGFDNCQCGNLMSRSQLSQQQGSLQSANSSTGSVHRPAEEIKQNLQPSPVVSPYPSNIVAPSAPSAEIMEDILIPVVTISQTTIANDPSASHSSSGYQVLPVSNSPSPALSITRMPSIVVSTNSIPAAITEDPGNSLATSENVAQKVSAVPSFVDTSVAPVYDVAPPQLILQSPSKTALQTEVRQLTDELALDEIRLLRQQNAELDRQLKEYKEQINQMTQIMNQVDAQRDDNTAVEKKARALQNDHEKEVEALKTTFRGSISAMESEMNEIRKQLNDALEKKTKLEKELEIRQAEIEKLNKSLEPYKINPTNVDDSNLKELEEAEKDCEKYRQQNIELLNRIRELEEDLTGKERHVKSLADKITIIQTEMPRQNDSVDGRQLMIKAIKDLKRQYDDLRRDKLEMIKCYENKLKTLQIENKTLRFEVEQAENFKPCTCEWDSNQCRDVLIRKTAKFGIDSLMSDELEELHNRVRIAMLRVKRPKSVNTENFSFDYYSKIADELRVKYNLNDSLPVPKSEDPDDVPVKDIDTCSSKTFPSILRKSRKSLSAKSVKKPRSAECNKKPAVRRQLSRK